MSVIAGLQGQRRQIAIKTPKCGVQHRFLSDFGACRQKHWASGLPVFWANAAFCIILRIFVRSFWIAHAVFGWM
ncbi:hypothetical protein [Undibacterium squillarum]|uniref:hypothetical protein n=1 Tax=Undibacterium squillarum TaxID=1131567 RepID=UPI0035AF804A